MNGHLRLLLQMVSKVHGAWIFLFRFLHNATASKVARCFVSSGLFFYSFLSWGVWLHLGWLTCEVNYPHHPSQWTYSLGNWNWFLFQCVARIFNLHSCAQGANQKIVPRSHFLEINCSNFPPSANLNQVIVDPLTPYMQGKHPPFNPKSLSLLTHNTSTTYTVLLPFAKLFWHEEVNYLLQSLWETWLFGATGIGVGESWALLPSLHFLNFQKLLRCHQPSWTLGLIQNSPKINLEMFNTLIEDRIVEGKNSCSNFHCFNPLFVFRINQGRFVTSFNPP